MEIPIIAIGNSKGIRLSKAILEQYHIQERVELLLEADCILLKPIQTPPTPRKGWSKAFKEMHKNGDDSLLMDDVFFDESFEE
jgi:antitoxin MazE